jgi:hypothetical protein
MHDEFLAIGKARNNERHSPNVVSYDADGVTYFSTAVVAPRAMTAYALTGSIPPAEVRLNGEAITGATLKLEVGANPLVLKYTKPGRTWFVVSTEPDESAIREDAFSPTAFWIWYPGDRATADRWFRKVFDLDQAPAQARLRITCDNGYAVFINGVAIGGGSRWEAVQEYDVTKSLRVGRNEIIVRAHNDGADAGLIAELIAGTTRVATDTSWRVAKTETGESVNAQQVAGFTDSHWYQHQQGPPKLELVAAKGQPKFKPGNLAMTWWTNVNRLPFDVRANEAKPVGWYRFVSPPGLRGFTLQVHGKAQAWADGKALPESAAGKVTVPQPSTTPATVLLRVEQERGCYAGAAFDAPIQLDCGPGQFAPGDWSRNDGLLSYSGGAWYRKTVTIPEAKRVTLNLGDVASSAEVRVNGQLAGIKVAPPWTLNITPLVKPGVNRIEVLVCNTLANHYTTVPTQYRGSTISGLLGPVRIDLQ